MITYNVVDIPPAWRTQLAQNRYLVLPLEIHGYTRAYAFQRDGDVLHARKATHCGFVRAQGSDARPDLPLALLDGELLLRCDDDRPVDTEGLEASLRGPRHEAATGVTVRFGEYFGSLQLFAATTMPSICRLEATFDKGAGVTRIGKGANAPALQQGTSLAYLIPVRRDGDNSQEKEWEFVVHSFGEHGPRLAEQLATTVRAWDTDVRGADDPALSVHPADTPDHKLPPGDVLDRRHCRLVFQWPGRDALLPAPTHPPVTAATLPEPM